MLEPDDTLKIYVDSKNTSRSLGAISSNGPLTHQYTLFASRARDRNITHWRRWAYTASYQPQYRVKEV